MKLVIWLVCVAIAVGVFFFQNDINNINGASAIGGLAGSLIGGTILWAVIVGVMSSLKKKS